MNIDPHSIKILCFGDSLTYGSDHINNTRLDVTKRWTGVLQKMLGDKYEIIEEGLGGRTTELDDPNREGRNGLLYFKAAVASHIPLDLVVILIGTNDLKKKFDRTPQQIASSFVKYKEAIKVACDKWGFKYPKVLLVAPPLVREDKTPKDWGFTGAGEKSMKLAQEYKTVADKLGFEFTNLAPIVKPSDFDGTHIEDEGNAKIADAIYNKLIQIIK